MGSAPVPAATSIAYGCMGAPSTASVPALATVTGCAASSRRAMYSAIGDRHMLAWQTKSTSSIIGTPLVDAVAGGSPRRWCSGGRGRTQRGCRHRTRCPWRRWRHAAPGARRMKIGILSYHFPPEPAFIPGSLAEELAARGHEVRVLTGFPDYPGGHVYPGLAAALAAPDAQRAADRPPGAPLRRRRRLRPARGWRAISPSPAASRSPAGASSRDVDALYVFQLPAATFAAAGAAAAARPGADRAARAGRLAGPVVAVRRRRRAGAGRGGSAPPCAGSTGRPPRSRSAAPSMRDLVVARRRRPGAGPDGAQLDRRADLPADRSRAGPPGGWSAGTAAAWSCTPGRSAHARAWRPRSARRRRWTTGWTWSWSAPAREERRVRGSPPSCGADNVRFVERRSPLDMPRAVRGGRLPAGDAARPARAARERCPASCRPRSPAPRRWSPPPVATPRAGRAGPGGAVLPAGGLGRAGRPLLAGRRDPAAGPGRMGRRGAEAYLREMSLRAGRRPDRAAARRRRGGPPRHRRGERTS